MKSFIKVYVDEVITKTKSLIKYLSNLHSLFELFIKYNISISLINFFLNYFNINLLKRRVNSFKLITIENKFEIIKIIKYFNNA